jgi:alpha-tubulin suppressor-like RCC1 family protein
LNDGSIWAWGNDEWGQLCTAVIPRLSVKHPVQITPPAGVSWTFAAAGGATDYFLDASGNVWGCGSNAQGQLGQGNVTQGAHPTPRNILSGVASMSSTNFNQAAG